jgi:hypothetical protein
MTRESVVFLTGIVLFLVPNLGIPEDWKYAIYIGLSIILMIVGYMLRHAAFIRRIERSNGELHTDSFVEQKGNSDNASPSV